MNKSRDNQNTNDFSGDFLSWVVIIICLLVFWPVGLFLLLKKVRFNSKKTASFKKSSRITATPSPYSGQGRTSESAQARTSGYYQSRQPTPSYYAQPQNTKTQPAGPVQQPARNVGTPQQPKTQKHAAQRSGKGLSVVLALLGIILGLTGIIFLSTGLGAFAANALDAGSLGLSIFGVFCLLGGLISLITRGSLLKKTRRFSRYAVTIGSREVVPVSDISKVIGISTAKTRKILLEMIDDGYFGAQAYLDNGLDSLVRSSQAAEKERNDRHHASDVASNSMGSDNQYVAIINEFHMLCARTIDSVICTKIEILEGLTAKIFRVVEDNPSKRSQLRRFFNYYLPTTLKLLRSYETLEKQGVNGENIQTAKQDIERILDTLAIGFEQQLDDLFLSDMIDISSDIDVLENLIERDSFKNGGDILQASGGH